MHSARTYKFWYLEVPYCRLRSSKEHSPPLSPKHATSEPLRVPLTSCDPFLLLVDGVWCLRFDESKVQNIQAQNKNIVAPLPCYIMPPNFYLKLRRYVAFLKLQSTHFSRQLARTQRGRDAVGSSEHTESGEWTMG